MRVFIGLLQAAVLLAQPPSAQPMSSAVVTRKVDAGYTPEARAAGLQGVVSLYVEVDRGGKPAEVQVMEGLGLGLDEEAVKAVRQWEFRPKPAAPDRIQDILEVDVPFRLDAPAPWFVESERYGVSLPNRQRYGEIVPPAPVSYAAPDAAACREAGTAIVRLTVAKDGKPLDVRPAEDSPAGLTDAAVKAVESWQFKPAKGKGKTLEANGRIEFACRPEGEEKEAAARPEYRAGGRVSPPVLISKTSPEYAEAARKAKVQGTTTLYIRISPEGKATQIHVTKRLGMGLDRKAIESIKKWRFRPGMKDGQPVTVEATVEVNFRLL